MKSTFEERLEEFLISQDKKFEHRTRNRWNVNQRVDVLEKHVISKVEKALHGLRALRRETEASVLEAREGLVDMLIEELTSSSVILEFSDLEARFRECFNVVLQEMRERFEILIESAEKRLELLLKDSESRMASMSSRCSVPMEPRGYQVLEERVSILWHMTQQDLRIAHMAADLEKRPNRQRDNVDSVSTTRTEGRAREWEVPDTGNKVREVSFWVDRMYC